MLAMQSAHNGLGSVNPVDEVGEQELQIAIASLLQ
jgi:hypothetical protein